MNTRVTLEKQQEVIDLHIKGYGTMQAIAKKTGVGIHAVNKITTNYWKQRMQKAHE